MCGEWVSASLAGSRSTAMPVRHPALSLIYTALRQWQPSHSFVTKPGFPWKTLHSRPEQAKNAVQPRSARFERVGEKPLLPGKTPLRGPHY
jgi:hypothetical protein